MRRQFLILALLLSPLPVAYAGSIDAVPEGKQLTDSRLGPPQNLNGYFPFQPVESADAWPARQAEIRRRILVSQGLWPLPTKAPLNAVVHGRVERDDYTVDRVFFESIPGHFVTGSLYRPKDVPGPYPAIISPHGHWQDGRFYDHGEQKLHQEIAIGSERFDPGGRFPIQARCVQLARMGCVVFQYDMTGYADSIQIKHRPDNWDHLDRPTDWGFMSVQAELRLQNMMGLQTWNSIRALDFILSLDDIDTTRVGVTGASGGGTQSMLVSAIDHRITASMPCVMVSTGMQGGCTCENAPLLRIDQGNVDIAAATAPRPLGLTAADDWTRELQTKGYPDLQNLYQMLGHPDHLTAAFHTEFGHNYNHVNRTVMYGFFNKHFNLGFEEPVLEREYEPLSREEATVWTDEHPAPKGNQVGDAHEVALLQIADQDSTEQINTLIPRNHEQLVEYRRVIGGAWETILGRTLDVVGEIEFELTSKEEKDGYLLMTGLVTHTSKGEQIPAVFFYPGENWNGRVALWFTDDGKSRLISGDKPHQLVQKMLDAGIAVVSADLFGQGEFNPEGKPPAQQQMWYQQNGESGWHRFAGYTFGYNHPLFVRRVHDVLTMLAFVQRHERQPKSIDLIGTGQSTGPVIVAAQSQAGNAVSRTFADIGDFDFQQLTRSDDPMFVPGAVKYLGIEGLVSLCNLRSLTITGDRPMRVAQTVASADSRNQAVAGQTLPARVETAGDLIELVVKKP
ncbi:MAG: acetylxylan esterase [Planctomycetaceae bacterium]|nr:acetylxylan esterase [Planctomycetaceae bacterium]